MSNRIALCECGHDAKSHLDFVATADCLKCSCQTFRPARLAATDSLAGASVPAVDRSRSSPPDVAPAVASPSVAPGAASEALSLLRDAEMYYGSWTIAQIERFFRDMRALLATAEAPRGETHRSRDWAIAGVMTIAANLRAEGHTSRADALEEATQVLARLSRSPEAGAATLRWAVERWNAEVANRPLANVHRRSLDETWRQVIRHFGGDDEALCGPRHDDLLAARAALPAVEETPHAE